jgi:hypothetical protein
MIDNKRRAITHLFHCFFTIAVKPKTTNWRESNFGGLLFMKSEIREEYLGSPITIKPSIIWLIKMQLFEILYGL